MLHSLIQRQTSIRKKILMVTLVISTFAILLSFVLAILASIVMDYMYGELYLKHYLAEIVIFSMTSTLSIIAAHIFAKKYFASITLPIFHLCGIATSISDRPDYTIRAKKYHDDEIGLLADSINTMLDALEKNAQQLKVAQDTAHNANIKKSEFLAMMSHEIRTPLNGIIGSADLLADTQITGRQRHYVDVIEKSAQTLFELINDILDFSKIEADKMTLEQVPFKLSSHIYDVIDILEIAVQDKGLDLVFRNNLKQDFNIVGDPVRLKQILINLVGNAIKFTDNGSITITIEEADAADNIKQIWFSIKDTGIGIPLDRQASIFDHFSQADSKTTRQFGGTGLGLAICKRLVGLMNGTIGVESTPGQGSTFWFSIPFPIATSDNNDDVKDIKEIDSISPNIDLPHVMLVEDNETNIMITSEILIQAGYDVTLCRNGLEAVACYKQAPAPLILMDCQMPEMDGWDATKHIRDFEKETGITPSTIIALTANAMEGDREKCIAIGMDDYIPKPFKKQQLLDKLSAYTQQL